MTSLCCLEFLGTKKWMLEISDVNETVFENMDRANIETIQNHLFSRERGQIYQSTGLSTPVPFFVFSVSL